MSARELVGIDVGGTFTDFVWMKEGRLHVHKEAQWEKDNPTKSRNKKKSSKRSKPSSSGNDSGEESEGSFKTLDEFSGSDAWDGDFTDDSDDALTSKEIEEAFQAFSDVKNGKLGKGKGKEKIKKKVERMESSRAVSDISTTLDATFSKIEETTELLESVKKTSANQATILEESAKEVAGSAHAKRTCEPDIDSWRASSCFISRSTS